MLQAVERGINDTIGHFSRIGETRTWNNMRRGVPMNMRKLRSYPAECTTHEIHVGRRDKSVRSTAARKQLRKYNDAPTCIRGRVLPAVRVSCILSAIAKLVNA